MIEQVLVISMGTADTIMVSSAGEFAISAVNIVDNINNLFIIAFTALSAGGAVIVSQYIGRQDYKNSSVAAKQLILIVTIISLCVMAVIIPLRRPIISLIYGSLEDDVMYAAALYFFVIGLSYPFLALQNANAALFRAIGNSKTPMYIALLTNILKICLNAAFIFAMGLGVFGAALSTLICRIIAAVITTVMHYRNPRSPVSLSGVFRTRLFRPMIKNILNVGVPGGLESSIFFVGRLLTQRIFPVFGTAAIAANAITSTVNSFSFMPGTAYGLALITIVGQCVGAGNYEEAKRQTRKMMILAYITMVAVSAAIFIFMEPLVGLFGLSPEAVSLAVSFLRVHCISMALGWAMGFILPNALRAAGDVRFVMFASVISMWTVRVACAYLFAFTLRLGPMGVWLGMGADFFVRGTLFCYRWISGKWQGKKVIDS